MGRHMTLLGLQPAQLADCSPFMAICAHLGLSTRFRRNPVCNPSETYLIRVLFNYSGILVTGFVYEPTIGGMEKAAIVTKSIIVRVIKVRDKGPERYRLSDNYPGKLGAVSQS